VVLSEACRPWTRQQHRASTGSTSRGVSVSRTRAGRQAAVEDAAQARPTWPGGRRSTPTTSVHRTSKKNVMPAQRTPGAPQQLQSHAATAEKCRRSMPDSGGRRASLRRTQWPRCADGQDGREEHGDPEDAGRGVAQRAVSGPMGRPAAAAQHGEGHHLPGAPRDERASMRRSLPARGGHTHMRRPHRCRHREPARPPAPRKRAGARRVFGGHPAPAHGHDAVRQGNGTAQVRGGQQHCCTIRDRLR